jgi:hypothetical protein
MQRSDGGGSFQTVDMLNGKLMCGCDDVHACVVRLLYFLLVSMHGPSSQMWTPSRWKIIQAVGPSAKDHKA